MTGGRSVVKTTGIVPELRKALEKVPGIERCFVFGSVAAGTAKEDSDADRHGRAARL